MLISKTVNVKITSNMCKYYKKKGYSFKCNDVIEVKIEDLPLQSNTKVWIKCDVCGKEYQISYCDYTKRNSDFTYCCDCKSIKAKETCLEKYGVDNVFKVDSIRRRQEETVLKRYGCKNVFQNDDIKEKSKKSLFERYGKYNPMQIESIKLKVFEHSMETMSKNRTQTSSKNQLHIHNLYGGELNYLFSTVWLDIYFIDDKIYCEYDGSGHNIAVKYGKLTYEQFKSKEIKRYKFLKSKGLKEFRIISRKDILPSDNILVSIKNLAFNILLNSISNFIVFDIDNQVIRFKNNSIQYNYLEPLNPIVTTECGKHLVTDEDTV